MLKNQSTKKDLTTYNKVLQEKANIINKPTAPEIPKPSIQHHRKRSFN
jgi:hypothetical protein